MTGYKTGVHVYHKLEGLEQVWTGMSTTTNGPMQHFIWSWACAEAFKDAGKLQFVAVGSDDQPVALAPLIIRNRIFSRLEMIGVKELYEPMDFLYADRSSLDHLARTLVEQGIAIWLRRLPADSPVLSAVKRAFRRRGLVHTLPVDPYPYLELNDSWKEPERSFNSGRRSDFRRAQRHASRLGEISYEILSPSPEEVGPLLEEAYQIEMASWKGAAGTALAADPVRGDFYRHYALAASERGILRLVFLRIGGRAVGMQIAIECGDRFWLLKIGHDEQFSKCSPGTLLMLHSISYAACRGLRSYEFLGIEEPWTRVWTGLSRPCVSLRAYPLTIGGLAVMSCDAFTIMRKEVNRFLRRHGGEK